MKLKFKKGDKVIVLSGKDKGKQGTIEKVHTDDASVLIKGVNVVKKHVKPGSVTKEGGIISIEKPIGVSCIAVVCSKCKEGVRVGYKMVDEKKYRICKNCGNTL